MLEKTRRTIEEVAPAPPTPQPASEEELERSTDDDRSGDLLQLMVPVATERLMSAQTPSTELTDDDLEEEELVAGWGADVLQLPSSLELDIKVQKGPDTLGVSVDSVDKGVNGMLVVAVVSGGAIAKDGRIVPGDYLLSLNNESLRKVTNSQARAILRRAQLLSTDISVTYIPGEAATAYRKSLLESEPPIVPLTKAIKISPSSPYIQKESEVPEILRGDKLVLRESELDSNLVSETATSSAADTGVTESDSITAVSPLQVPVRTIVQGDKQVLLNLGSEPISEVIVTSEPDSVSWRRDSRDDTVSRKDDQSVTSIPPSRSQGSLSDLSSPTMTVTQPPQGHTPSTPMSSSVLLAKHWGPERMVEILREPNCSLGISIVGGKVDLYNAGPDSGSAISGIFIKNVLPHSPAGRTGELKTGDRILEVDGIDLRQASHERAVEVIRGAGNPVCFLVQSLIQWSVDGDVESQSTEVASTSSAGAAGGSERRRASTSPTPSSELLKVTPQPVPQARTPTPELIQAGMADEMVQEIPKQVSQRKPSIIKPREPQSKQDKQEDRDIEKKKPIYSSSEESEDEEDVRELEGNMYTKKGHEINRASAGNVKRTKEEIEADPEEEDDYGYTKNKVKKKYGGLGHPVLLVQMERGAQGLGLSLAGHKDRNRMAVFVVGLNPAGAAFKTGAIHVGDEILEVNGVVLQGRCHLNASAIIKGLPGPIFKVILLRRDTALQDLAVKPITQFPVTLDDETPEERYSNFRGLRTVTIKKGSQGLGIMIIEGKHAEVGQGIFISDIQEGSAAEQAGLIVGDMILAVNKDTLLGADYDSAASLLKKTEGVVTLVVCNPNKAKEEEKKGDADGKGANAQSPSPGVAQSSAPSKEPEKPRLLPKPFITSLKPQKTSPSKSNIVSPSLPPNAGSPMMETLSPGMGTSKSPGTPGTTRSPSAASTPALVSPSISPSSTLRLSPTPSGKHATTPEEPPVDPVTCEITAGKETTIEINKDKMGLGLSIVGGSDTLLSVIIIHEVYPDGAAAKDGRLKPGDQILEVNSEDFRNITHSKALAALRQTPAKVKMVVYRDEASAKEEDIFDIMEVELTKKPGKGLGLSIVGRRNGHGVFISDVVHGGTAEACGKLMKGDQILAVNGQDLKSATQEEAAAVLKTATGKVSMKLGRLKAGSRRSSSGNTDRSSEVEPQSQSRTIVLERGPDGLGFSIVGGHCSPHGDLPIYVKTVFEKGAAARGGQLRRGDQIVAVDGLSLEGLTHQQAVAVLKHTQGNVTLTIQS